jgi:hypothetical protein
MNHSLGHILSINQVHTALSPWVSLIRPDPELTPQTKLPDSDAFLSIIFSRQQLRNQTALIPSLNILSELLV